MGESNLKTLMYCDRAGSGSISLTSYEDSLGVVMPFELPDDILRKLLGRQCWVKGSWGDIMQIVKWEPLPEYRPRDEATS